MLFRSLVVADAERPGDLLTLAGGFLQAGLCAAAGSGGFAWALAAAQPGGQGAAQRKEQPFGIQSGILVVSLSMKQVAREQVARLLEGSEAQRSPFVRVDLHPERLASANGARPGEDERREIERLANAVRDALRRTRRAVVTVADGAPFVAESGLTRGLSEVARRALAPGAQSVQEGIDVGALVAVGGDTVRALCAGLDCTRLEVGAVELEPGVPLCRLGDGSLAGLPLVMKSGSFGDAVTLVRIVDALAKGEKV